MPAGDVTVPTTSIPQASSESIVPHDSTAGKTMGELAVGFEVTPTSIEEEHEAGGWNRGSPQDSSSVYNEGGMAGLDRDAVEEAD
jgi:hypothetical protein